MNTQNCLIFGQATGLYKPAVLNHGAKGYIRKSKKHSWPSQNTYFIEDKLAMLRDTPPQQSKHSLNQTNCRQGFFQAVLELTGNEVQQLFIAFWHLFGAIPLHGTLCCVTESAGNRLRYIPVPVAVGWVGKEEMSHPHKRLNNFFGWVLPLKKATQVPTPLFLSKKNPTSKQPPQNAKRKWIKTLRRRGGIGESLRRRLSEGTTLGQLGPNQVTLKIWSRHISQPCYLLSRNTKD